MAEGGAVVGAALVNRTDGEPPYGGPWIAQVFREPGARGVGGALLRRALAIATRDGLPRWASRSRTATRHSGSTPRSGSPTCSRRSTSSFDAH